MNHTDKKSILPLRISACFFILLLIALDQWTKLVAVQKLQGGDMDLVPRVLKLHYLQNTGAAFSFLEGKPLFFLILTPVLVLCICAFALSTPMKRRFLPLHIIYMLLISGALGNLIDRVARGYVTDFIYFCLIDFPVFNVADIYVTLSMLALILLVLFYYQDQELEEILPWRRGH